jgi:hypothetical protein
MLVVLAFALSPIVAAAPPAQMSACKGLDVRGRTAMQWFISGAFPVPSPWIECREDNGVNARTLQRQKAVSVPCLLQVYQFGLAGSGLWSRPGPPPTDGAWAINVLGQVDPPAAIALWREKAFFAKDPWTRLGALLRAGELGDPTVLPDLALGLADPPNAPDWTPDERDVFLANVADLLAQYDYRPALSALEHLSEPPRPALRWLHLHVLQLQGDVATLARRTWDKDGAGYFAVRALYRMRAREALASIAADPKHPRSHLARHYLSLSIRL